MEFAISMIAFVVSIHTVYRSIRADRLKLFLDLHSRFRDVYAKLPTDYERLAWADWTEGEKLAGREYWHVSRAEWLATTRWGDRLQKRLWKSHYSGAQVSGSEHPGLSEALRELTNVDRKVRGALWDDYVNDLNRARAVVGLQSFELGRP